MVKWAIFNEAENGIMIDFERESEAHEWLKNKHEEGFHKDYHVGRWEYESRQEQIVRIIKEGLKSPVCAHVALTELAELHGVDPSNV